MQYLYKITNKISGTVYFGITNNMRQRWYVHKHCYRSGYKTPLYDAMRSYGIDNFLIEVIEEAEDKEYIANREIEMIANTPKTYNLHRGGHIGFDIRTKGESEAAEWIAKLTKARQGKKPALGMKHSEENKKLFGEYGKLRWDIYGRYPKEVLDYGFAEANKKFGISKTHYYRLRKAAAK